MAKPINRTDRMNNLKQIPGTNKGIRYDQNGKGARQISCPSCQSAAISPSLDGLGNVVYRCKCGAVFKAGSRLT